MLLFLAGSAAAENVAPAPTPAPAMPQPADYQKRRMGDAAFANRDFDRAVDFYREYKAEAAGNHPAELDAVRHLVAALLQAGQLEVAAAEIAEYRKNNPNENDLELALLEVDRLLLKQEYAAAESRLRQLDREAGAAPGGELQFKLLSALGFALLQQQKFLEANQTYVQLIKAAAGTNYEFTAQCQDLYAQIASGNLADSRKLLDTLKRQYADQPLPENLQLLEMSQMVGERRFSELKQLYSQFAAPARPNLQYYRINRDLAEHFLTNQPSPEALAYLETAFDYAPTETDRRDTLRQLINAAVNLKQTAEAIEYFRKYLTFYPADPEALELRLQLAKLHVSAGQPEEALTLYRQLTEDLKLPEPIRLAAAYDAAQVCAERGDRAGAVRFLEYAGAQATTPEARDTASFRLGEFYFNSGEYQKALEPLGKLLEAEGEWRDRGIYWMIQAHLKLNNFEPALLLTGKLAESAVEAYRLESAYLKPLLEEKLNRLPEALKDYQAFVAAYPAGAFTPPARYAIGSIEFKLRNYAEAEAAFRKFAADYPDNDLAPDALYQAQHCAYFLEDSNAMLELMQQLLKRYPDSKFTPAAQFWWVDFLKSAGRFKEAQTLLQEMYDQARRRQPELLPQILYDQAVVAGKNGENGKALVLLKELLEKYPQDPIRAEAFFLAGDLASLEADYAAAAEFYRQAAELRPDTAFARAARGRTADCNYSLYARDKQPEQLQQAVADYQALLADEALDSFLRAQTIYKLGVCRELEQKPEEAAKLYDELLYLALDWKRQEQEYAAPWVAKAGYAAVNLALASRTPEGAQQAIKLIRLMRQLDLNTGEDFDAWEAAINRQYQL